MSCIYKNLHYSQQKLINQFWQSSNEETNHLAEFIVSLAQHVNSGETYGASAKVLNRLCYNDFTAARLSSLMENYEVVYNNSSITNVFNYVYEYVNIKHIT